VNGWWEPLEFTVPVTEPGASWDLALDTYEPENGPAAGKLAAGDPIGVRPRSIVLLHDRRAPDQLQAQE
jgi:hypothetical protein